MTCSEVKSARVLLAQGLHIGKKQGKSVTYSFCSPAFKNITGILESLIQLQSVYGITRRSIKNKVLDFLVVFVFFPMPSTASKTLVIRGWIYANWGQMTMIQ
uniref:Uncharacterized protein LOC109702647 isoform X2 n=1 Tax=Castor canadensis TaxID=51338 RepID=A0A8B7WJ47_CASCN|nr:uncharacterized protein LOC109702647 isoform X2 [Castor canadensis]